VSYKTKLDSITINILVVMDFITRAIIVPTDDAIPFWPGSIRPTIRFRNRS